MAPTGETGNSDGTHLHFHVTQGNVLIGGHVTVAFEMSDRSSFYGAGGTNGPSDNAGVGYTSNSSLDALTRAAYLANGGASASWWNVGAPFTSTAESNDEAGGICRNQTTAFVHTCGTGWGIGLVVTQNYLDWKAVRHSVYRTSNYTGHVKGQIQGSLSNLYFGAGLASAFGAPIGPESGNMQQFEGGALQRRLDLAGVRVDVIGCGAFGCGLTGIARWSSLGEFCPSVDANDDVNAADIGFVRTAFNSTNINYDLDMNPPISAADIGLVRSRFGMNNCPVADP